MTTSGAVLHTEKFQHTNQEGALCGDITVRSLSTAGALTYTPQQFLSGIIKRDPNGATRTDTTPTAANLAAKFPELHVGFYFDVEIYNIGSANDDDGGVEVLIIAGGTNVTIIGPSIIQPGSMMHARLRCTATSTPTWDMFTWTSRPTASSGLMSMKNLTTTYTVNIRDSGTVFLLNSGTEFAVTLPAVATVPQGWWCEFIVKAGPSGANYTIVTNGSENKIHGTVQAGEDAAGSTDPTDGSAADTITFVGDKSKIGDRVSLFSDGTFFYATAYTFQQDAVSITTAS